jgi:hypothetical protein
VHVHNNDLAAAKEDLHTCLQLNPKHIAAYSRLTGIYQGEGNLEAMVAAIDSALKVCNTSFTSSTNSAAITAVLQMSLLVVLSTGANCLCCVVHFRVDICMRGCAAAIASTLNSDHVDCTIQ